MTEPKLPLPQPPSKPTAVIIPTPPPLGSIIRIPTQVAERADEITAYSLLGNPVYSNLVFEANDAAGTPDLIINDVILSVQQTRNIITTSVAGRAGTVKEYISEGDYVINAKILAITNNPNLAPYDLVRQFASLFSVPDSIEVASDFLGLFNIDSVVIRDYNIGEIAATRNTITVDVNMLSDEPFEIQLNA